MSEVPFYPDEDTYETDRISRAVEKAVREERAAAVTRLRARADYFDRMSQGPMAVAYDGEMANLLRGEADDLERGEHRK
jgi:hypothetical protein